MANDVPDLIVVHVSDNAATALRALPAETIAVARWADGRRDELALPDAISLGHKVALVPIRKDELVIKHGYPIGRATADIAAGEHVHVHNVLSLSREARDTVSGVVPVIKVCGNPETFARMSDNMDVNAGAIVTGDRTIAEVGNEIFNAIVKTAGGQLTRAEELGHFEFHI